MAAVAAWCMLSLAAVSMARASMWDREWRLLALLGDAWLAADAAADLALLGVSCCCGECV
jgi:hypothetical protein